MSEAPRPAPSTPRAEALDSRERRKRRREWIAIAILTILFVGIMVAELRISKLSSTLPFVNSIFFFGLLNLNLVILLGLVWLVFRNIGKLFLERRRRILGSRLKTKLVIAFLAFSIIPTLVLFVISALYINSSFDKWFSLKIQNTLQASLEITRVYYKNADQNAMHFAEHLAAGISQHIDQADRSGAPLSLGSVWLEDYLESERNLLALDAVEFYLDPLDERMIAQHKQARDLPDTYPRLALDLLDRAFSGERVSVLQHVGSGDLIRCLVPIREGGQVRGVVGVDAYIPVSLVNKVDEIASVFDDYKDTNPLKYPMKTTYSLILVMITLVILFVAIWIGLYMAKELTVPVERLVHGAQEVGAGNLDVSISGSGHDEIAVLVESFNKMTQDLRENRKRLDLTSAEMEKRRLQLEAVLANVGTGVIVVDNQGVITTFNRAVSQLLEVLPESVLGRGYAEVLVGEAAPLCEVIRRTLSAWSGTAVESPELEQWNFRVGDKTKALASVATALRDGSQSQPWGAVVVIDDMTYLIKGQREMAWREVARRIAHEIKNPLTPIKLSAQRLQRKLGDLRGREGALLKECTDTIIKHTDELKEMVNEFSNFARFPEISPAPHDLNAALEEVIKLYQQAHPQIQFKFDLDLRLPIFEFDRDQLKRLVINLLDNAVAALSTLPPGKHRQIRIETHHHAELQMAVLIVQDNGPGMTDQVKARVFEPYFSTKADGTGLGLAIAKRIVSDHDGFIRVQSAPDEGTQFLIELPTAIRHSLQSRPSRFDTQTAGTPKA